jgi:DHA3 family macrolide efflux protein-like MFS transporter
MSSIWSDKRFLTYVSGLTIDRFGNALYAVVMPLLVYHLTSSALSMSIMAVVQFLPRALFSLAIGSIIDRVSRRVVIFVSLTFQALCSALLAVLYDAGLLQIWMVYAIGALLAVGFEFSRTAEIAVVPVMFPDRKMEANAGLGTAHTLMFILGPTLAGVMFGMFSYSVLLWINALTYLAPILMCIWSRIPHETHLGGVKSARQVGQDIVEGLRYLMQNRYLFHLLIIILLVGLGSSGITTLVLFHLKNNLAASDSVISWFLAVQGLGLFLSSFFMPRFKHVPQGRFLFYTLLVSAVGTALFLIPALWMMPIALCVAGIGGFAFLISKDVVIQTAVKNEMMGRIGGTLRMVTNVTTVVSASMLGGIAAAVSAEAAFLTALLLVVFPLLLLVKSPLIRFDQQAYNPEQATRGGNEDGSHRVSKSAGGSV